MLLCAINTADSLFLIFLASYVSLLIFLLFSFGCFKACVYEKLHYIEGRVGKENRNPMELVHVIRRVNTVGCAERAEHLRRQFEIHHVDDLVTIEAELAARYAHHNRIPLAVVRVP